jgi:hypothetical protein
MAILVHENLLGSAYFGYSWMIGMAVGNLRHDLEELPTWHNS